MVSSLIERKLIQHSMTSAEVITGLAGAYGSIFFDLYGVPESRYRFIPTGLDEAYLDRHDTSKRPVLVHVGEVMPNQSVHAFQTINRAVQMAPASLAATRLEVIGRREINQPRVESMIRTMGDWRVPVDYVDHLPQAEVYARVRSAKAALLVPGRQRYWWNNFAKLVDYIALGIPVIADVPPISEAREELTKAGGAHFLGGHSVEDDARGLAAWLEAGPTVELTEYRARYTARRQAAEFAELFGELLDREEVQP
jgi:hypothetical protein